MGGVAPGGRPVRRGGHRPLPVHSPHLRIRRDLYRHLGSRGNFLITFVINSIDHLSTIQSLADIFSCIYGNIKIAVIFPYCLDDYGHSIVYLLES